jgi:hypothetical protein
LFCQGTYPESSASVASVQSPLSKRVRSFIHCLRNTVLTFPVSVIGISSVGIPYPLNIYCLSIPVAVAFNQWKSHRRQCCLMSFESITKLFYPQQAVSSVKLTDKKFQP